MFRDFKNERYSGYGVKTMQIIWIRVIMVLYGGWNEKSFEIRVRAWQIKNRWIETIILRINSLNQ